MIQKKLSNEGIFDSQIRQFVWDKFAETVVVEWNKQIPVYVFGHGYFNFLFFVSLYIVQFDEDQDV